MNKRSAAFLTLLFLLLVGVNAWSWCWLMASRKESISAEQDTIRCSQLADDIIRLKQRPAIAGSHEIELTELSRQIEQAATTAGIPPQGLVQISPESARRLDSNVLGPGIGANGTDYPTEYPYVEKPTTVLLSGITLQQLARFLYVMSSGSSAMDVRSLRISAPRQAETGDRWNAEVTLSYLVYVPREEPSDIRHVASLSHDSAAQGVRP